MKREFFSGGCFGLGYLLPIVLLVSCNTGDRTPNPSSSSPVASPAPVAEPIAKITEIAQPPVLVSQASAKDIPAQEGMELSVGATIRTQNQGSVQVELKNGLAFRIGSNAVLTLLANNRLNLNSGEMITWVEPGKRVPAEIVTPGGVAGIRGTTVYVDIPQNPNQGILFFDWEGNVSFKPSVETPQAQAITLLTGQEVTVKPGETDLNKIRQRRKQISRVEWRKLRECIKHPQSQDCRQQSRINLYRNFKRSLPTQRLIDQAIVGKQK
jgi:hypothetical protein